MFAGTSLEVEMANESGGMVQAHVGRAYSTTRHACKLNWVRLGILDTWALKAQHVKDGLKHNT